MNMFEIFILDESFRTLYNIDVFESLIWTERYLGAGNFEFYTPVNDNILSIVSVVQNKMEKNLDCYAWLKESDSAMIIENIEIKTDTEIGNHLIISGSGLESILKRRIIWEQTSINGNLQNGVKRLLNDSIISPSITNRKIPNLVFSPSTNESITKLSLKAQYTGDELYDTIYKICETYDLGFDVVLDSHDNLIFSLTIGEDRSYDQNKNQYVIFSPKFENMLNSDYLESQNTLKNVTLVAGEGEGKNRKTRVVGSASGMSRKELYTDARDIQSDDYNQQLEADKEILEEYKQKLSEDKQSLDSETKTFGEETAEYRKKETSYNESKTSYETRMSSFNRRISDYNAKISEYEASLNSDEHAAFVQRNEYKNQIKAYDDVINACTATINSYNNKLKEEANLSYDSIIQYEQIIADNERIKAEYEPYRSAAETAKSEAESKLPNYKTTLEEYEKKISEYEGIVSDDQKSLDSETKSFEKETSEYQKKANDYNALKAQYESNISQYNQKIAEYENKIKEDERTLNKLYNDLLDQRGKEKLAENLYTKVFTGEIEATNNFVYGRDFFKGDIVQVVNEFGMESKVRVLEVVRVQDTTGYSTYPTFQVIE